MYIAGLVIPVPEDKMDAYRQWAENGAQIFKDYGCLEIVESWEDYVPDGKQTDFRRAVAAKEGEKIVFSWQVWPDKTSFYAAEAKMQAIASPALQPASCSSTARRSADCFCSGSVARSASSSHSSARPRSQ